jgi:hypothetical protein
MSIQWQPDPQTFQDKLRHCAFKGLRECRAVNPLAPRPQPTTDGATGANLVCHPAAPCLAPFEIHVQWTPERQGVGWCMRLVYSVRGPLGRLRFPAPATASACDGLWAHTCFEAFFSEPAATAYRELNFSPSTHWAHYRFERERVRDEAPPPLAIPEVQFVLAAPDQCKLSSRVAIKANQSDQSATWFAPTAVLELSDGSLSYWAVHHPKPKPDFHARDGWCVPLAWSVL